MKIIRYRDRTGVIGFAAQTADGARCIVGDIFGSFEVADEPADVVKVLAPVDPRAIFGIGLNYRRHAAEAKMTEPEYPVLFFKAPSAIQNPNDPIELPRHLPSTKVDFECELAVVIGKRCKNVGKAKALDYVMGYCCANDVSARDWQITKGGSQWSRGKTFDTFCPLGPCLVTTDEILNPNALAIRTILSGEVMQDWNTSDMIFDVPALIEFLSGSTTLEPGTVILTGTPHGVGSARNPPRWLAAGDTCVIEIERIGALANPVIEEKT